MANDSVNINIGGDSSKAQKAYDALLAKNAQLEASTEKMAAKLKKTGKDGVGAFEGIGKGVKDSIVQFGSAAVVLGGIMKELNAISEKAKEIKGLKDQSSKSVDAAMTKVFLEGSVTDSNQQDALRNKAFDLSRRKGISFEDTAKIFSSIMNEGGTAQDINRNVYESVFDLKNVTGASDAGSLIDIQNTALKRAKMQDTKENRELIAAKLAKGFGQDIGEGSQFLSKLPMGMDLDTAIAMADLGKKNFGGSIRKADSTIEKAFGKGGGGVSEFLRATGTTKEQLNEAINAIKNNSLSEFQDKKEIYSRSIGAMENRVTTEELATDFEKGRIPDSLKKRAFKAQQRKEGSAESFMRDVTYDMMDKVPLSGLMSEEAKQEAAIRIQSGGRGGQSDMIADSINGINKTLGNLDKSIQKTGNKNNKPIDMKNDTQINVRVKR